MGRCLSVRPVETVVIRHAPCCASLLLLLVSGCGQQSPAPVAPAPQQTPVAAHSAASEPPPLFAGLIPAVPSPLQWEMVKDSGLDFTYYGNPSPQHYMTEQNGGGVAVFDYDRDGRVDVLLTNGDHFARPAAKVGAVHHLYHNQTSGRDQWRFVNVSASARIDVGGFGMGAVAGDFDNDGFPDLCLCYYGDVQLWKNQGDGTFENVTTAAQVTSGEWSTSAVLADLDADGDLDLYIVNYVKYASTDPPCFVESTRRFPISCGPLGRDAQADRLWENLGDGTFRDASVAAGIHGVPAGKGLAVAAVDLTGDDQLDLYVANDTTENFLFVNQGGLKFLDEGIALGVAVGPKGTPESSMGIACADFDHNGRFDLVVTNFENAVNDYYLNVSAEGFMHPIGGNGLDLPSRPQLGFAALAADFEGDGAEDLFVANGHIWDLRAPDSHHQYEMSPQMFRNQGTGKFDDVSAGSGDYFRERWLGRSAAVGDFDNNGVPDLIVSHQLRPAALLRNRSPQQGQRLLVSLVGVTAAREPLGVRVTSTIDGTTRQHHVPAGEGYQSSSDPRVLISTGKAEQISLTVHWGPGHQETRDGLPATGWIQIVEGQSQPVRLR